MQTCSLKKCKKLLLLVLISLNFTKAQSFSLDDAVRIALKNKEALKASALDLATSKQNIKESYSSILPSMRLASSLSESRFPKQLGGFNQASGEIITSEINSIKSSSSSISLSQNIYDGGIWWNTIRQAKNSFRISEQFDRQIKTTIINNCLLYTSDAADE